MKIESIHVETETNFEFDETVDMGFHEEAHGLLLNNMIRQYSNPYLAAFREYTSNARDSHRLAGQTRPIEVTLPSDMAPSLTIEDFGVGLTRDELKGFGQFGKSSKRDDNEYTGGFGLGSKSALAMASQFSVTSVKDGKRNTVIVHRAENGAPKMGFPFPEQDAPGVPNGVRITIPTMEIAKFRNAIENGFFFGWAPGTIAINSEKPEGVNVYDTDMFEALPDDLGWELKKEQNIYDSTLRSGSIVAIISGVRYDLDMGQISYEYRNNNQLTHYVSRIVLNLENGAVEIHPSRETLIYDKRTRDYIDTRLAAITEIGAQRFQADIELAPTWRTAMERRHVAIRAGFDTSYTYKGAVLDFPAYPEADMKIAGELLTVTTINRSRRYGANHQAGRDLRDIRSFWTNQLEGLFFPEVAPILITGTTIPENSDRSMPTESFSATLFFEALGELYPGVYKQGGVRFVYTTLKRKHLPAEFKKLFVRVFDAADYTSIVSEWRKKKLAAARGGASVGPYTSTAGSVRIVSSMTGGASSNRYVKIADLDVDHTHVLMNLEEDFVEYMFRRNASNRFEDLFSLFRTALAAKPDQYTFIYATASTNTKKYSSKLPNYRDDLMEVVREIVLDYITNLPTDAKELIGYQKFIDQTRDNYLQFARNIPTNWLDQITDEETKKNLLDVREGYEKAQAAQKAAGNNSAKILINYMEDVVIANLIPEILDLDGGTNAPTTEIEKYPMMEDMYLSSYGSGDDRWARYVHYVNAVDLALTV